jgi:hypothetical protein
MSVTFATMTKKAAVLFLAGFLWLPSRAQDLTSRLGEPFLPEAKDWSIGFDATRLIKVATFEFLSASQAVTGKYFIDPHTAYRASLRLGLNTWSMRSLVLDRVASSSSIVAYPAAKPMKQNSWNRTSFGTGISAGIEKRRGKTRVQGLYGVEGGFSIGFTRDNFSYGNALNASPLSPVDVDDKDDAMSSSSLGNANNIDTVPAIQNVLSHHARVVERKSGLAFTIGARAFLGAEFFFLPKMSVGGEFGWGLAYTLQARSETTYESVGQSNVPGATVPVVRRTIVDGAGKESFSMDADNGNLFGGPSASLRINLYF